MLKRMRRMLPGESRKVGRIPPNWVARRSVKSGNRGKRTSDERGDHWHRAAGIGGSYTPVRSVEGEGVRN